MGTQIDYTRRQFLTGSLAAGFLAAAGAGRLGGAGEAGQGKLRLGGPVSAADPDGWIASLKSLGYRAAYCPVAADASDDQIKSYAEAAGKADIVIAEVGAWSNPLSPNESQRQAALALCCKQLALADRIGARCCVNISGSRNGKHWAGPHPDNLTADTFDLIVETCRRIIDEVRPTRTYFTLETMPWAYPDSVESYQRLLTAVDRDRFAVHLDPVNLLNCPERYYNNAALLREAFARLGHRIKSCHAKDIILAEDKLSVHLDEIRPGLGYLDYAVFLRELSRLPDTPLMLEHLASQEEYRLAADHIRSVARRVGVPVTDASP
ncbi:MAG: TIM barrel protein [Sedimentisphaerales bacterium]|nr:TIM barrel protein [Sedimentisphaerales bacterium]